MFDTSNVAELIKALKEKETNEKIRNIEVILAELYSIRFNMNNMLEEYTVLVKPKAHHVGTTEEMIIIENEIKLIDKKIFNFIKQKNELNNWK